MAAWREVGPRMQRLQEAGFAIYADRANWHLAFHLAGFSNAGDAVLLFSAAVNPAGDLPVIVPLSTLEKLVEAAKVAKETA